MNIVWFKRDLRIHDHKALSWAAETETVIPLYIFEPDLWRQPDMSFQHFQFLKNCLLDLNQSLTKLGQGLIIKVGSATEVFQQLHNEFGIKSIYSHQETWNHWTYRRDLEVKDWCKKKHITWHEPTQNGVIRYLKDRDGWSGRWYKTMRENVSNPPSKLCSLKIASDQIPGPNELSLNTSFQNKDNIGGRKEAIHLLDSFLHQRGEGYTKEMSSPLTAYESCSRLSPHIAFGTISIKEVFQAVERRKQKLKELSKDRKGRWPSAIRSFSGRLRWHCHFIQKLEDDPSIEFKNMHPAYDNLRQDFFNEAYFLAWKEGRTGFPMIDACMRALIETGWLNFRMRAMLMSFASYHLWLHWQKPALYLAQLFTDYEPGIHYSQVQMQSGTTGINSIRIYNPIKQGLDHDPDGIFIRKWIPELIDMDNDYIHTPWKMPSQLNGYPMPIINEAEARKSAASQLYGLRKNRTHKETAQRIVKKHASRKQSRSIRQRKQPSRNAQQGELPL
ncbi:FAD-binding domain-containing protein [Curvivirga aplysinae]|uniref:FAD-binding domain-containing protein n=1 Tax=Curvivirga aplysinae TaxID=2529852 RepID=UPI0012BCCF1E|nr:deoxyribodipyrimidine photo-lyase [Curvivirga aplysinae]MTI10469.1 deoxyribodipyrimidine photo-lyase [Curvivirga aplysinae]